MAAYAAVVSLMNLIEQIQNHPRPPITLDKEQAESLTEKVVFLQDFLEAYNSHYANQEVECLRSRIANAACAAEDIMESHVVDQIQALSTSHEGKKISFVDLYQGLQKVIQDLDFIKKEVVEIKDKMGTEDQLQRIMAPPVVSSKSPVTEQNTMVGFDDVLKEILDKLTGQEPRLQIIPISGMGGIGKTTLARNVYTKKHVERFDVRAWVTISQKYNVQEILSEVLCQINQGSTESFFEERKMKLEEKLYKSLFGRRYLIIMDDMWSTEVWNRLKKFFPECRNGSRIIVTTRQSNVASDLSRCGGHKMNFLDQDKSWSLFCKTVFGGEDCPPELKHIGIMIANNCKGLPLSIVVIGRLLAKFKQTREYWEYIAKNLISNVNLEENELCLKILSTSYDHLPVHLKACFLYMGIFPEDSKIRVSELIKLWVAEGFLKPIHGKTLEESAEDYLMDLIDRNLILVGERGSSGKLKFCNIHDLLRDLCLRQAQKEKFLFLNTPIEGINTQRRIAIHQCTSKENIPHCLKSELATRSLICYFGEDLPLIKFKLLRVLKDAGVSFHFSLEALFQLVNLRYLAISPSYCTSMNSSSVSLWNLQTLIIERWYDNSFAPPDIWKMRQLRHVKFCKFVLLDPPNCSQIDGQDDIILENLQTLVGIQNFKCSEEMVKRIPNVKKLVISYFFSSKFVDASEFCLNNLFRLHKLESLCCYFNPDIQHELESIGWFFNPDGRPFRTDLLRNVTFPDSLKKLTLCGTSLFWEDMSTKIGSLPHLEVLKLKARSFIGPKWETIEGQFPKVKYLLIEYPEDLEYWTAESDHFPSLEHLVLNGLVKLTEIPSGVGEIPNLQSIRLEYCSDSLVISAKQILDEQEELGNEDFRIRVLLGQNNDRHLERLASRNFQVET